MRSILWVTDAIVISYFLAYAVINLFLLGISALKVRRSLEKAQLSGHQEIGVDTFAPMISLIVPAYNEAVTIVESVRSLLRMKYPRFEVILVNDGSSDETLGKLKKAFAFVRADVDYRDFLGTAPVRGFYRAMGQLPPHVERLLLVDKENGGKADALNAGLNASHGTYVASMDADSLMVEEALHATIQPILDDPNRVVACGGQIALSNGCRIEDGRVVEVKLPKTWVGRFQAVEYMRSFTQSRTALGHLDALLILSGVFALFQREAILDVGGFLTPHMRSRIGREYCGSGAATVCEDMEVVVRLQRYLIEHGIQGRIVFLPFPTSWTEAPEVWGDLGKQRNRWYRGLWEVLWLHRKMIFRPRYGRVGMFSLPYQLMFEALAPLIETVGYLLVPLSLAAGVLESSAMFSFLALALSFNLFLSTSSMLTAVWRIRLKGQAHGSALIRYRGFRTLLTLVMAGFVSNVGYRQYLLFHQLKGLHGFLVGKKTWDKFARKGFSHDKES